MLCYLAAYQPQRPLLCVTSTLTLVFFFPQLLEGSEQLIFYGCPVPSRHHAIESATSETQVFLFYVRGTWGPLALTLCCISNPPTSVSTRESTPSSLSPLTPKYSQRPFRRPLRRQPSRPPPPPPSNNRAAGLSL